MENLEIELKLNLSEVNYILESLSKRPFGEVAEIISKIRMQGESQLPETNVQS